MEMIFINSATNERTKCIFNPLHVNLHIGESFVHTSKRADAIAFYPEKPAVRTVGRITDIETVMNENTGETAKYIMFDGSSEVLDGKGGE